MAMYNNMAQASAYNTYNHYIAETEDPQLQLQMRLAYYQAQISESNQAGASNSDTQHTGNQKMAFQNKIQAAAGREYGDVDGSVSVGRGGKYARYTTEQVEALEMLYSRCPKPTLKQRQQLLLDCPTLRSVDQNQIKVWFQNRRCREKQRKKSSRLQVSNGQLSAMNSMLMDENARLRQQFAQLMDENNFLRHHLSSRMQNCNTSTSPSISPCSTTTSPPSSREFSLSRPNAGVNLWSLT